MQQLHILNQKKQAIQDKMTSLWDIRDKENREWTREQKTLYEQLETDAKELSKELNQRLEYQKYLANTKPEAEKKFERQTNSIGIGNLCRYLLYKKHGQAEYKEDLGKVEEFTREAQNEFQAGSNSPGEISIPPQAFRKQMQSFQRALTTATASGGQGIEDIVFEPTLDVLYASTTLGKIGAKVKQLPAGSGAYKVVKLVDTTANRSSAKAESADLDVRELTVDDVFELSPKRLGRIVEVSNLWLKQAKDPGVIERNLLMEINTKMDEEFLVGTGTNDRIKGITLTTGLLALDPPAATGANVGQTMNLQLLVNAVKTIEEKNASSMGLAWIVHPAVKAHGSVTLKSSVAGSEYLFERGMLNGIRTAITTLMPNNVTRGTKSTDISNLFLTTPSLICLPVWGLASLSLSDTGEKWLKRDQTAFRIQFYGNAGLERPEEAHVLCKAVATA